MDHIRILQELIAFDTSVPPGDHYSEIMGYLVPLFHEAGLKTQLVPIPAEHAEGRSGRVHLLCHRRALGKPRLIFYAHVDVVPADGWSAFQPTIKDGKLPAAAQPI